MNNRLLRDVIYLFNGKLKVDSLRWNVDKHKKRMITKSPIKSYYYKLIFFPNTTRLVVNSELSINIINASLLEVTPVLIIGFSLTSSNS